MSLSRPTTPWVVASATVVKNLQIAVRYLPNLLGTFVEMAIRATFFLLMANTVSVNGSQNLGIELTGQNLYIFFLGSLLLFVFTRSTLWGPINAVSNDLYNGTLEYLYSSPSSRYAYYVGVVLSEVIISQVVFIPLLLLLIVTAQASLETVLMILMACAVVLAALTAMGIMIALLGLIWRQVGSLASVLGILFEMLAGAYLPLTAFPRIVQYLAYLLPYTWGYDLVRFYSFKGVWRPILPIWQEWSVLIGWAILFTLVSRYLLKKAEMQAKKTGLNVI